MGLGDPDTTLKFVGSVGPDYLGLWIWVVDLGLANFVD